MRPGRRSGLIALIAGSALIAFGSASAWAAFPLAQNGNIAYQGIHESSLGFEVFSTKPDGSGQQDWTNSPDYEINPSYSPDGRKIVFARAVGDGNTDIWTLNTDGSGQIDLTNTPTVGEVSPVFSPDGKKIAYSSNVEDPPAHLYVMNADGSGQHLLANTSANDQNPDFSPDGSKIAFDHCSGVCDIYTIAPDGSGLTNITNTPTIYETDPSFSPDGKRIAFTYSAGSGARIATMNADGTGVVVSADNGLDPFSPVFSPDGHLIAFGGTPPSNTGEIYTVNLDGSGLIDLTNTPDPLREEVPAWQSIFTCGGRQATIVGSDAGEKLKGTKGADVIVGNGGNDRIKGLAGNDRICGGAGRDRIAGGAGSRDVCKGQAGKDFGGKGCERGKL
jgi:Tol biopolymer transport system component